jgi:CDP-diacylglycerol--serine O-phosphatidyltransferase
MDTTTAPRPADAGLVARAESPSGDPGAESQRPGRRYRRRAAVRDRVSGAHTVAAADPQVTLDPPRLLTGDPTRARRLRFVAVQACTVSSLLLGMAAIFLALDGQVRVAALALLACVAFDGLDGALARRCGVCTPFGAQMDSLADMCSFGIATPVVAYAWLITAGEPNWLAGAAAGLVGVCAALRLARFNVSPPNGSYFSGVPTTIAAAIIAGSLLILPGTGLAVLTGALAALALLMVSTFPYVKLGQLRRMPPWLWAVAGVALWADPRTTFILLVGAYLLSGPLLWAKQRRAITV